MQELKEQMDDQEYVGQSAGGKLKITITGRAEMRKVYIDPSLIDPNEKEVLEDLVIAAFNNAKSQADSASQSSLSNSFADIPVPPGFKMPF